MNRILYKHFLWCALVACLSLAATLPTRAEDVNKKADEKKNTEAEVDQVIANLQMAQGLIEYGRSNKMPEALVTAALILHRNPVEVAKGEKDDSPTPKSLLAEARALRPADKGLAAVIDSAADSLKEATRAGNFLVAAAKYTATVKPGASSCVVTLPVPNSWASYKKITVNGVRQGTLQPIKVSATLCGQNLASSGTRDVTLDVPHGSAILIAPQVTVVVPVSSTSPTTVTVTTWIVIHQGPPRGSS